ncbi:MAG: hypothetical protein DRH26_05375 [Deltaproteobacteria bacterium]|nr:MAG: hypothetical protein DRH26_05375 [Deltaproteobacteria bacterium]
MYKRKTEWRSTGVYQHPVPEQNGIWGHVTLEEGIYRLQVGPASIPCPQKWAAKIEEAEGDTEPIPLIVRGVPNPVHRALKSKSALAGKTIQGVLMELITKYVEGEIELN